jgi:hypothetical protein
MMEARDFFKAAKDETLSKMAKRTAVIAVAFAAAV